MRKSNGVLPLTLDQVADRARYLARDLPLKSLDPWLVTDSIITTIPQLGEAYCPDGYYRLEYPNGNSNPKSANPWSYWRRPGSNFLNRTADCIGGATWCGGFDRYQPDIFPFFEGSINCDSMLMDARHKQTCFKIVPTPLIGAFMVYDSEDYDGDGQRDRVGHISVIIEIPAEFDPKERACWAAIKAVDVANRGRNRANEKTTGLVWFGNDRRGYPKNSQFVVSVMEGTE